MHESAAVERGNDPVLRLPSGELKADPPHGTTLTVVAPTWTRSPLSCVRPHTCMTVGDVFGGRVPLLDLVGYHVANGRRIYSVQDTPRHEVEVPATRWHVQLSARYTF